MVDDTAGDHQSGVEGATSNATEGMPCSYSLRQSNASSLGVCAWYAGNAEERHTVVEPVPEAVEAVLDKVFRSTEVEPWIDCTSQLANCSVRSSLWY